MYHRKRVVHFVGIGGIGMSGLAEVLFNLGHQVSGSDLAAGQQTRRLEGLGVKVTFGHSAENIKDAEVVVVSSAVGPTNPEVVEARLKGIPVIPRAEMLAELMRLKSSIAVAGSHGKTSVCSLLSMVLTTGGLDPTLVVGGRIVNLESSARLGKSEFLVAEADESDGSFLLLSPIINVVTNIDQEHMNYYRDMAHLEDTFLAFINRVPFYGASIICLDDPRVQSLIPRIKKRYVTYGLSSAADATAKDVVAEAWGHSFNLSFRGQDLGRVSVGLPGRHNVLNALAACAVGLELGLPPQVIAQGVASLKGVGRRFEKKGEINGVPVLDDYGHHPTEIRATLATLADCFPDRRKLVLFQPHRHTRTQDLFAEFARSFNQADLLFLADIYGAGEPAIEGVTSQALAEAIRARGHRGVESVGAVKDLPERVLAALKPQDVVLTLGAGNINQAGEDLILLAARANKTSGPKSRSHSKAPVGETQGP
ncbi:MAG: UDP-N-acetylmuramate--L-alanine ligase [Deltaproteobacteria bacterium]|jgi:UDP-N-acetylmuramate--alanine ligase|nr:UDP-N-acetylmuramate--L-alanine ligase [Deltaproteobacteria bacterium]